MSNHLIPVTAAATLISNFATNKETILTDYYQNSGILPTCETFDRDAFDLILADTNCTGVRIYLGMDTNLKVRLVIAGVDSSDEDLIIADNDPANSLTVDAVMENGVRCPTMCPPSSALNS